jgi:hypothetical protein
MCAPFPAVLRRDVARPRGGWRFVMKWWKLMVLAVLLAPMAGSMVGCEVDADADDDGAKLKVDVDD